MYTSKRAGVDVFVFYSAANKARDTARDIGLKYQSLGFNVVFKLEQSSDTMFKGLWKTDGISGIVFGGHGAGWEGQYYGYIASPGSEGSVFPSSVSPPYKLAFVGALHCGSTAQVDASDLPLGGPATMAWSDHVSSHGHFVGFNGDVHRLNWKKCVHMTDDGKEVDF